jgi:hypothetical protein
MSGGDLQIRAVFPEGDVVIDQFEEPKPCKQEQCENRTWGMATIRDKVGHLETCR